MIDSRYGENLSEPKDQRHDNIDGDNRIACAVTATLAVAEPTAGGDFLTPPIGMNAWPAEVVSSAAFSLKLPGQFQIPYTLIQLVWLCRQLTRKIVAVQE